MDPIAVLPNMVRHDVLLVAWGINAAILDDQVMARHRGCSIISENPWSRSALSACSKLIAGQTLFGPREPLTTPRSREKDIKIRGGGWGATRLTQWWRTTAHAGTWAEWQGSCISESRNWGGWDPNQKQILWPTKMGMRPNYAGRHVPVTQHEAPMHSDNEYGVVDRLLLVATSDRYPPFKCQIDKRWWGFVGSTWEIWRR